MREGTIPPNWTYLVQRRSKISAPENIDLKDTWFTPDPKEDPKENPSHEPSVDPENVMPSQSISQLQGGMDREGAYVSEVIKCPSSKGVRNT